METIIATKALPWLALIPLSIVYFLLAWVLIKSQQDIIKKFGGRKTIFAILILYTDCVMRIANLVSEDIWKAVAFVAIIAIVGGNVSEHITNIWNNKHIKK